MLLSDRCLTMTVQVTRGLATVLRYRPSLYEHTIKTRPVLNNKSILYEHTMSTHRPARQVNTKREHYQNAPVLGYKLALYTSTRWVHTWVGVVEGEQGQRLANDVHVMKTHHVRRFERHLNTTHVTSYSACAYFSDEEK